MPAEIRTFLADLLAPEIADYQVLLEDIGNGRAV
jgi:hypothetical protein